MKFEKWIVIIIANSLLHLATFSRGASTLPTKLCFWSFWLNDSAHKVHKCWYVPSYMYGYDLQKSKMANTWDHVKCWKNFNVKHILTNPSYLHTFTILRCVNENELRNFLLWWENMQKVLERWKFSCAMKFVNNEFSYAFGHFCPFGDLFIVIHTSTCH